MRGLSRPTTIAVADGGNPVERMDQMDQMERPTGGLGRARSEVVIRKREASDCRIFFGADVTAGTVWWQLKGSRSGNAAVCTPYWLWQDLVAPDLSTEHRPSF